VKDLVMTTLCSSEPGRINGYRHSFIKSLSGLQHTQQHRSPRRKRNASETRTISVVIPDREMGTGIYPFASEGKMISGKKSTSDAEQARAFLRVIIE